LATVSDTFAVMQESTDETCIAVFNEEKLNLLKFIAECLLIDQN
jgi:hypothetical protein